MSVVHKFIIWDFCLSLQCLALFGIFVLLGFAEFEGFRLSRD